MKANKLLKVLSAATIISTLAVVDYSATTQNNKVLLAADTQNPEVPVKTTALNAYEAGKISMANASIVKLTVQKVANGYKYKLILKDVDLNGLSDGVSKLWIEGQEISLQSIEYTEDPSAKNPKLAEFTLPELKSRINATVFVQIMEKIGLLTNNPGQGTKDTILSLDLTGVEEKLTPKPAVNPKPAAETPAKPAESKPVTKPETPKDTQPSNKPADPTKPADKPTETVKPVETPKPKEQPKPVVTTPTPKPTPSATATYYKGVKATLLNAYRPGQKSMGDAALEHSNVTVYKEGSTYHYIVRFHNISVGTFNDGITGFWVNGTEYPVNPTGGANKQVEVHFTSTEKLSTVPVSVFVQAMESIMAGGGKQNATLSFDWSNVTEQQGQPIAGGNPGSSNPATNTGGQPTSPITTPTTPVLPAATQEQGVEVPVTFYDNVTASLLNAYESGRASMGNAALDGITVFKHGDTYHYKVRFHDIKVGTLTDGITRFWVNGTEYPVNKTGGAMNQVEIHFTSNEKLTNIPVSVFVPTMESIMPGAGKKDAILSLNWSNATERQGTAVIDGGQPGASTAGNGAGALTPKGGRLNNGRLSNTGLETSSSILAGALTLMSAFMVGRRKQK
ncbi:hypothetical protein ACWOCB_01320 [Gemella haemolysans]|uniref:LPXTG-motif cell wall anchor domain protein n=1 Tax=Gemella haemolysans ATCC 10379 TaxID=546270 RepID=C5NUH7_9BACL|nr:hypothetical protein [Gemella haemolysans]EER69150.1 LPXTG-motif cell wall anchor domain protein [Gemella haemolysans ATCC 10379]KAA8708694.1 hypothetical protein F4V11_01720 [Gemella haemolysans]UBH82625.1 hypothetical protein LA340_01340 [Gemella haemolysans]VEI39120.1 Iron Transport-associated domain [Gemella haemolysans]